MQDPPADGSIGRAASPLLPAHMEPPVAVARPRHMHSRHMHSRRRSAASAFVTAVTLLSIVLAACAASPTGTPTPGPISVETAEAAARLVATRTPLFDGIGPRDPDLIGQASWWEAVPMDTAGGPSGWRVTFRTGWGDCQADCIDEHAWTYDVTPDGSVSFVGETGSAVPQAVIDALRAAARLTGVAGRVIAGPTCPVERPGDPACVPRAVGGATLVVTGAGGNEVARVTTDASGLFRIGLQPGDYVLQPQPVEGLMGTATPLPFTVTDGSETFLDVAYDTGIR